MEFEGMSIDIHYTEYLAHNAQQEHLKNNVDKTLKN